MAENVQIEPGHPRPSDSLKQRIWFRMLSLEQQTMLTSVFFIAVVLVGVWIGVNELNRMGRDDKAFVARSIQRGAGTFDSTCAPCHGRNGEGTERAPILNKPGEFDGTRLKELGFQGTLKDYFTLTISAGRPARSNPAWPNPMPTWSQDYGGPLRPDQVNDVVNFVMNWGCAYNYKYNDMCQGQDQVFASQPTPTPEPPTPTPKPVEKVEDILARLAKLTGDPARGKDIYSGKVLLSDGKVAGCSGCHSLDGTVVVGPSLIGAQKDMPSGYSSFDFYVIESIIDPNKYKVPGFENANMPLRFHDRLTDQDLADLLAFVKSVQK